MQLCMVLGALGGIDVTMKFLEQGMTKPSLSESGVGTTNCTDAVISYMNSIT